MRRMYGQDSALRRVCSAQCLGPRLWAAHRKKCIFRQLLYGYGYHDVFRLQENMHFSVTLVKAMGICLHFYK